MVHCVEMFTLLYFYTDTRFLLLHMHTVHMHTVHLLEYHQQHYSRSSILTMQQISIFEKVNYQENY